ncbi:MAG: VWA domain-containing protein, partial [Pirellulaceae bacterium]
LMLMQRDPIGLITFDTRIRASVPPRSRRSQLAAIRTQLTKLKATGETDLGASMVQLASMLKHRSLVMVFSDLLMETEVALQSLRLLRGAGHDVIVFHVMDEAEVSFPFDGVVQLHDPEQATSLTVNADEIGEEYRRNIAEFRETLRRGCHESRIDYVPLHTGNAYDKGLTEYLLSRRGRF